MQELSMQEIDDVAGGKSGWFFAAQFAADFIEGFAAGWADGAK